MGCGCRKKRKPAPLTTSRKASLLARKSELMQKSKVANQSKKLRERVISARANLCNSCPHSAQDSRDKKYNIKMCHKINRPIDTVSKDLSLSCPVGKFKSAT